MKTVSRAEREELERQFAYELDRELSMMLARVSGRALVVYLLVALIASAGLYALMLYVVQRLHG